MNWFDHIRRAVSVVLVAIALVVLPTVANATFKSTKSQGLVVGTDRMETPTGVTGTYRCIPNGTTSEAITFTTTGFTDSGPSGATYKYSIIRAGNVVKTQTSTSKSVTVNSGNLPVDYEATPWTISIQTTLGNWTGTAYTKTITCALLGNGSGSL
jgi:hypothetical protein